MSAITKAQNATIEIEALLALAASMPENDPKTAHILSLAKGKVAELSSLLESEADASDLPESLPCQPEVSLPTPSEEPVGDDEPEEFSVTTDDIETAAEHQEEDLIENAESQQIESCLASGEDTLPIPPADEVASTDNEPEVADECVDTSEDTYENIATKPISQEAFSNSVAIDVSANCEPQPAAANYPAAADINERVFINNTRDLSKAFTLNDKFRFRRELFGNSNAEFTRALDLISVMRSPAEADEYFFTDLGWDPENEDVKDFMRIIRGYLSK